MSKSVLIMFLICLFLAVSSKPHAEDTKCYFPDIPSFSEEKKLPDGSPAGLSFVDYQIVNPKGAALLLSCAQTLYKNAKLSQFNDASRKRLDRTMRTAWHSRDTGPSAQKDGYTALGGTSSLGGANDFGTMIIGPDKKLVAIGLILNEVDRIDENEPVHFFNSNFVFIYKTCTFCERQYITIPEMQSILDTINPGIDGLFVFSNEYFLGSNL